MNLEQLKKENRERIPTNKCNVCDGDGYTVEADPSDQSGQTPMQVQCDYCHAEGEITTLDCIDQITTTSYQAGVRYARQIYGTPRCGNLHHKKAHQHGASEPCLAEQALEALTNQ